VKSNVTDVDAGEDVYVEVLNPVIEVLIVDGVLIVPHSVIGPSHLVADEKYPVVSGIGLVLRYCRARSRPSHDSGLHSNGGPDG